MIKIIRPQPAEDEEAKKAFDALIAAQSEIEFENAILKAQNNYKKWNTRQYSDPIKEFLFKVYNGKCGFCEEKLLDINATDTTHNNTFTVEHYRPKTHYWWLGNEWTNLFPTCLKCNNAKDKEFPLYSEKDKIPNTHIELKKGMLNQTFDYFNANCKFLKQERPLFLHPEIDEPENYFSFENGTKCFEMKAQNGLGQYEQQRATKMLNKFLNVTNVKLNRKKYFDDLITHLANALENYFDNEHVAVSEENKLNLIFGGFFKTLKENIGKDKRFSLFATFLYENFIDTFVAYFEVAQLPTDTITKAYELFKIKYNKSIMTLSSIKFTQKKATRDGFGQGLYEVAQQNPNVVALCADLIGSLKMEKFIEHFPQRFVQVGIAEANMMGIAAGLATAGKIPYTGTFANFSTGRVYDQIRQSIAYSHKNVKICASHAGLTLGEDGATHQILEDMGMMKMLPNMIVINPCDYEQTRRATIAIAAVDNPVYLRFGRPSWPVFTENMPFEIGKVLVLNEGADVSIFATGHLVWKAVEAARQLESEGISCELINIHTIKPLDEAAILASVRKTKRVVVAEEHNIIGGLGESIAGLLARNLPAPMEFVGTNDTFGESGKADELLAKYGLDTKDVYNAAKRVLLR